MGMKIIADMDSGSQKSNKKIPLFLAGWPYQHYSQIYIFHTIYSIIYILPKKRNKKRLIQRYFSNIVYSTIYIQAKKRGGRATSVIQGSSCRPPMYARNQILLVRSSKLLQRLLEVGLISDHLPLRNPFEPRNNPESQSIVAIVVEKECPLVVQLTISHPESFITLLVHLM